MSLISPLNLTKSYTVPGFAVAAPRAAKSPLSPDTDAFVLHSGETEGTLKPGVLQNTVMGHAPTSAGTLGQQLHSFVKTNLLTATATGLNMAHGMLGMFFPPDAVAAKMIGSLKEQPIVDESKATLPEYRSEIPDASPDQVYQQLVDHTKDAFAAGGVKLRLSDGGIKDQGRYMIEAPSRHLEPAVWLPVEAHLDPEKKSIDLQCLDGHAFRGHNQFEFKSDGHGGTVVDQTSAFELSSEPINLIKGPMGVLEKQHKMWEQVHGYLFEHFEDKARS